MENANDIGGFQNDIIFDNTLLTLREQDCLINPAIGLFPLGNGQGQTTCLEDTTIGPCKNLSKALVRCGDPLNTLCPAGAGANISVFRAVLAAIAAPNDNPIPSGLQYTCTFEVRDAEGLPTNLASSNVIVASVVGDPLAALGIDGQVSPAEGSAPQSSLTADSGSGCAIDSSSDRLPAHLALALSLLLLSRRAARQRSAKHRQP
jgi:hypothetical protein